MRVLEVTEASGSGTLGIVQSLAAGLSAAGHEVGVAYGRRPETPSDLGSELPHAVELFALPWTNRTPSQQLAAARALRRLVRDWRPDVVHLHSSFAGAIGSLALHGHVPLVYTPHAYAFARAEGVLSRVAYRGVEWVVARRCELVGAVSEAETALARESLRAPRVTVVPNGIQELDPGAAEPAPRAPGQRVVATGRIGPQRQPAATAAILAAVAAATGAQVEWIGGAPGDEDAPLRAAGIPVSGWLPRREAVRRLSEASVYLHWSAWDGQSLAILEALAADVLVVASDIPANRELVGDLQVCRDKDAAIALILAILREESLREDLLGAQRSRRGHWSAQRMVEGWTEVYRGLACAGERGETPAVPAPPTVTRRNIGSPWK